MQQNKPTIQPKNHTLDEIANLCGFSKSTLKRKMDKIKFLFKNTGRKRFYSPNETEAVINHIFRGQ